MSFIAASLAGLLAVMPQAQFQPDATDSALHGYRLVWSDEFEAEGAIDPARWRHDTSRNRDGWYNDELQYYAAERLENVRVADGKLVIEARREALSKRPDWGGQDYASGRIVSRSAWTYGVIEARAKLPCGRGAWPAIWMLPEDGRTWPRDGEIDIMEHVGHRSGVVHGTVHTEAYNHVSGTQRGGEAVVTDACDAFHNYRVTWTPLRITFAVDGHDYYAFDNDGSGEIATWPFDRPFHLILNVAVGGAWGGAEGVDDAAFPQKMEIDWIRVYQFVE